jgi:hypothetical protein
MGLISNEETKLSREMHPALAFVAIWGAIIWLTMVEGGQASLVGRSAGARPDRPVQGLPHPIAYKCISIVHGCYDGALLLTCLVDPYSRGCLLSFYLPW